MWQSGRTNVLLILDVILYLHAMLYAAFAIYITMLIVELWARTGTAAKDDMNISQDVC